MNRLFCFPDIRNNGFSHPFTTRKKRRHVSKLSLTLCMGHQMMKLWMTEKDSNVSHLERNHQEHFDNKHVALCAINLNVQCTCLGKQGQTDSLPSTKVVMRVEVIAKPWYWIAFRFATRHASFTLCWYYEVITDEVRSRLMDGAPVKLLHICSCQAFSFVGCLEPYPSLIRGSRDYASAPVLPPSVSLAETPYISLRLTLWDLLWTWCTFGVVKFWSIHLAVYS